MIKTVASGDLRHSVELQSVAVTQNSTTGEMINTWSTVATPWADVSPISGREFIAAGADQSEVRVRVTIRYRPNVDAAMRVVHRGKYYNILAVLEDNDSGLEHLTLMCGEGVRLDQ